MANTPTAVYITERAAKEQNSEASVILNRVKQYHEKKLWHQLTEDVKIVMQMPNVTDKCGLYTSFVKDFESKLNPVSLVQIVIGAARAELAGSPTDALAFVSHLLDSKGKKTVISEDSEAQVLLLSEVACLHLRANDHAKCKSFIAQARELVDTGHEMNPLVHSAFYKSAAEYHKVVGTAADFFKNALQFLAYTPVESLEPGLQSQWAFDIGIAALVGVDVYNFGEVLSHSIIQVLDGSQHDWLLRLLEAFNEGDLKKFDVVCEASSKQMNDQPALVLHEEFLRQKITLLALMQLASSCTDNRQLTFKEVETVCRMPPEEVEFLLMRAMSIGLITGIIDNVEEIVVVTRVQPRVMNRASIGKMANRLLTWCTKVNGTLNTVTKNTVAIVE